MTADAGGSDATNALRESIERFNAKTARQTTWLLRLTWTLAALTLVMAIGVGVQIYVATSARAESAWVLWLEHSQPGRGGRSSKPCRTELPVDGAGPQPNGGLFPRSSPPRPRSGTCASPTPSTRVGRRGSEA